MRWSWITAILNSILPRHPRAERAVAILPKALSPLFSPHTVKDHPWIHALFPYRDERVRSLIQAVKYYGERGVVETLAPYAADYITELIAHKKQMGGWGQVTLVPIPSSPARVRERGYAQAVLLARAVGARVPDATYDESLLTREDRTSQVHVSRTARRKNMVGAFTAHHRAHGMHVILIDDVVESGATLEDARRALLDEGAKDVIAVALAH